MKNCGQATKDALLYKPTTEEMSRPLTPMEVRESVELVTDLAYTILKEDVEDLTNVEEVNSVFQSIFSDNFQDDIMDYLGAMFRELAVNDPNKAIEVKAKFNKVLSLLAGNPKSNPFVKAVKLEFNKRDFNIVVSDIEYDENQKESWQVDINGVDQYSKLSKLLKVELASVTQMEFVGKQLKPKLGFLGNEQRYPIGMVFSTLIDKLGNSQDPTIFNNKVKKNMNDPIIAQLFDSSKTKQELNTMYTEIFRYIGQMQKWEYLDSTHYQSEVKDQYGQPMLDEYNRPITEVKSTIFNPSDNNRRTQAKRKIATYIQLMGKLNNKADYKKLVKELAGTNYQTILTTLKEYGIIPDNVETIDDKRVIKLRDKLVENINSGYDVFGVYEKERGVSLAMTEAFVAQYSPTSISLSHRNQDGKQVYEVNKPNYLSRLANSLKEAKNNKIIAERYKAILNDPFITKIPLYKQLLNGSLRPVIFNSTRQVGEQKGTEYGSMNEKQLALQQLSMFLLAGPANANIVNAVHSDASIQTGMKVLIRKADGTRAEQPNGRLNKEEMLEALVQLAELEREMVVDRKGKGTQSVQRPNDHIIFPFLKDKSVSEFPKLIQENIDKSFTEYFHKVEDLGLVQRVEQKKVVNNKVVINEVIQFENGMFKDQGDPTTALYETMTHHLLYNAQLALMFNGDPSYYGNIDYSQNVSKKNNGVATYFKRTKQIWSPLNYLYVGAQYTNKSGEVFTLGEKFNTVVLGEVETYSADFFDFLKQHHPEYVYYNKDGSINYKDKNALVFDKDGNPKLGPDGKQLKGASKFGNVSLTDAQSYIDPIRLKQQMIGSAEWNDEWEESLDAILEGRFNIDNPKLYGPQKPFYFNMHQVNGRMVPFQNKDSEFILLPVFGIEIINGKLNPLFNPMHKWMMTKMGYKFTATSVQAPNQQDRFNGGSKGSLLVDKFTFDSAVKVGNQESYDVSNASINNGVEEQASEILETYLNKFGISVEDINNLKEENLDSVGVADILSKIAYIKDRKDLPPVAGKFIAYMMQYNPLVSNIVKELAEQNGEYKKENSAIYFVGSGLGKTTLAKSNPGKFKDMDNLIQRALRKVYPKQKFSQAKASEMLWSDEQLRTELIKLIEKYKETHIILSPINKNKLKNLGYSYSKYYISDNSSKTINNISTRSKDAYDISEEDYNKLYITPYENEKNLVKVKDYLSNELSNLPKGNSITEFADFFSKDNYKELDKDKYLTLIGNMISDHLQDKLSKSNTFFGRIKKIVKEFFGLDIKKDVTFIQENINKIVNGILEQNKDMITASKFKPGAQGKPVSQVSISDALNKDAFGKNIIQRLSKYKFILTGSTALSEQGTIMRPEENPLHDIDWVSPYNREKTLELFLEEFPNAVKVRDIISTDYVTDTYITPPDGYTIINQDIVDYNGRIVVNAYDVANEDGKIVGTYRFAKPKGQTRKKEITTGVEAKLIDFFSPYGTDLSEPPYEYVSEEGDIIYLADWKSTFKAKLEFARIKDIWDYNRFVPNSFTPKQQMKVVQMDNAAYGKQGEVPNHILDDEQKMAVQVRKNIIKDINPTKMYQAPHWIKEDMLSGRQLIEKFNELEISNLEKDMEAIGKRFNDPKKSKLENMKEVTKMLQEQILERNMDSRFMELIQLDSEGNTKLELDHPAFIYQIRQVFNAIYSKKVIQQKLTNGVAYANTSAFGFDPPKVVTNAEGGIEYYEAYAPVHNSVLNEFINEGEILDYNTMKERVQKATYMSTEEFDRLVTGIIWRIPNEKVFSNFHVRITKFFPSEMGGSIVLPLEMTALSGADFDIDKMYGFYYNYHVQYDKASINELLLGLTDKETAYIESEFPNMTTVEAVREIVKNGDIIGEVQGTIVQLDEYHDLKKKLNKRLKDIGKKLKRNPKLIMPYGDSKEGNHNKMMDLMQLIMKQQDTAQEILKTSDFSVLQDIREKLAKPSKPMNPFEALTHMIVSNRMLVGKQLIGPLANINSIIALLQQGDIRLTTPLKFNGKTYSSLSEIEVDGIKPSDTIGNWVAAIVDNGKDPLAGDLNVNWATVDTLILMLSAGMDHETSLSFLNEKIIRDYAEFYLNNGGNLQAEKKANLKFFGDENPMLTELKANQKDYTPGSSNKDILNNFLLYKTMGQQLGTAVTALKVAEGGLGASAGHTLSKIKQVHSGMNLEGEGSLNLITGVRDLILDNKFVHNKMYEVLLKANEMISKTLGVADYSKGAYSQAIEYLAAYKKRVSDMNLTKDEIDHIAHHLRTYLLSDTFPYNPNLINNMYEDLPKFMKKYPQYAGLMDVLILDKNSRMVKHKGNQTDLGHDAEYYRDIIKFMVYDDTPAVQKFVKALGIYSFYSDGFGVSPFGFSHLFPVNWFTKFYPEGSSKSLSLNNMNKEELKAFVDQYTRNNFMNLSYIPNAYGMASNKMDNKPTVSGLYKDKQQLFNFDAKTGKITPVITLGKYEKGGLFKISGKMFDAYKYGDTKFNPESNIKILSKMRKNMTREDYDKAMNITKKDYTKSIEQVLEEVKNEKLNPDNKTTNCE